MGSRFFLISFSRAAIATSTVTATATAAAVTTTAIAATAPSWPAASTTTIATTTAITPATIATATATVATPLAAAPIGFVGFLDSHFLTAYGRIVQRFNGSPGFSFIGHIYKPEAFASSTLPIHYHFRKIHCSIQFKHFFQVHIVEITGETCYKKLHAKDLKR
jgi:hypothetical protein